MSKITYICFTRRSYNILSFKHNDEVRRWIAKYLIRDKNLSAIIHNGLYIVFVIWAGTDYHASTLIIGTQSNGATSSWKNF